MEDVALPPSLWELSRSLLAAPCRRFTIIVNEEMIMKQYGHMALPALLCIAMLPLSGESWRALPVLSSELQTAVGPCARFFGKLSVLNFKSDEHMPLYEQGAPRQIFIIDYVESRLVVYSISFICPGYIFKRGPWALSQQIDDPELMALIRKTTGIQEPYGVREFFDDQRGLRWLVRMLGAHSHFTYKPRQHKRIRSAMQHPFVFVSSRVTDELLLDSLRELRWDDVDAQLGPEYHNDPNALELVNLNTTCKRCKYYEAHKRWNEQVEYLVQVRDAINHAWYTLCIEEW